MFRPGREISARTRPISRRHEDVADAHVPRWTRHGRKRTAAAIELGFDHGAFGRTFRIGLEVEQFGCKRDHLQSLSRLVLFLADTSTSTTSPPNGSRPALRVAAFGAHALRLGRPGLSILFDRHESSAPRRLGVVDRLDRLRMTPSSPRPPGSRCPVTLARGRALQ